MRSLFAQIPVSTRITGAYAASAAVWLAVSNEPVVQFLANSDRHVLRASLFVAVSALMLHVLIRRLVARFEAAEAAVRASDERWKFAVDGAGDGLWDWDGESGKVFYSPQWKAMLGYAETDVLDDVAEWRERIHPEDWACVDEQFRRHYQGETDTYRCEHRLRMKDGSYKWVLSRGHAVRRAADGRPLRVIGTHTDISVRKEAERQMKAALDFQQTILATAPVGILVYRADGQTVSANEASAEFFGTNIETLRTQNFRQLESWRRHGLLDAAERALRENCSVLHCSDWVTDFNRVKWCEVKFEPFRYDGEQRLMLIVTDTTKQHFAQQRLELLHAALEAAPTGWVITDAAGVIEWVNPGFTKLTGYALSEVVGHTPNVLKSGLHAPHFYANLWQTVRDGQIWQGELCNRRKDGVLYYERMTIAPVHNADAKITHFVAMKEDITGRHELEQQLTRSQRLESIGLLASGIAHDLNNMLAPIMLSVGMIKARHKDRETGECLDMMQTAAQRGASVVQQVLTFARGVDGERTQLDVRPLLKELGQLIRETFPRGIRIKIEVPDGPLIVEGDVTQLHQVLLNLAVNARDAMPDGGVMQLKAEAVSLDESAARLAPSGRAGNYVKLIVSDTGAGIPAEILERIFEPFFTTKPRGKGTGLGLSTVYGIVRSHGGFLNVQSKVGEGSSFAVVLPAGTMVAAPPVRARRPATASGKGRCVLVVDDEEAVRFATTVVLRKNGFTIASAADGFEAVRQLRDRPDGFSAAVVDLMMPGMNGYQVVRELRRLAPALPIVIASGMTGDGRPGEDRAALNAQGVRLVLNKPFTEADLLEALNEELGDGLTKGREIVIDSLRSGVHVLALASDA